MRKMLQRYWYTGTSLLCEKRN